MPTTKFTTLANLDRYTTHVEEKNVQVTRAEYTNLPSSKLTDNRSYFIEDEGIVIKNGVEYGEDTIYTLGVGSGADANKITLTPSEGSVQSVTVPYATSAGNANTVSNHTVAKDVPADAKFTDTTYSNATTVVAGLMSTTDKSKLDGIAEGATANTGTVTSVGLTAGDGISVSGGPVTTSGSITVTNKGVRSVAQGTTNGTINVNTNGSTADVAVKGLGSLAYKSSLSKSDVGLGNVANLDQSKAIKSITRSGTTFTATAIDGTTSSFTQQDNNTTYSDATTATSGLMSASDKVKLNGVASGAEVNQNAFSNVKVGDTTVAADAKTDTLELVAGTNVTLTPDATNDKVTIAAKDTTYSANNGVGLSGTTFYNSGVRSIATGGTNGTINVNTNGSTANVAVKGLGSAAYTASTAYIASSLKGANNGVAELDSAGKVPSSQLPSFVDDVLEYDSMSGFPSTGEAGKIYVAKDTNKTYRWSGTAYVEISPSLALGETSSTAYRGDRGKTAYDHSQATGNPHGTTKANVGLGNVANLDQSKAIKSITRSGTTFTATALDGTTSSFTQQDNNTTYTGSNGITLTGTNFTNSGVRSIATGTTNGTINVNTNGSTADVPVKGLAALAYKASLGKSDVGLGNVANLDQSKAIKSITRSGTTFTATAIDGTTSSFTQQDNNTTYTGANGVSLSGTTFSNSGVRGVASGTANGTINVNTNGSTADVAVKGLGSAAYTASTAYATSGHNHDSTYLKLAGGTLTGATEFNNGKMPLAAGKITGLTTGASRVYGDGIAISNPTTSNDVGFIRVTGTGESDTVLEICTGDDGGGSTAETIAVRQYNTSNAIAKEAKLLDPSGNTSFPGTVTAASFSGSIANATGLTKSQVTTALGYTPPTTDTNTTYSAGSNITLTGTVFSLTKANVTGALGYTPPTTNTTYSNVSTSSAGLAPKVTSTSAFLKGDGTWATPTNTTYSNVSTSAAGLAPKITDTSKFLKGDGTWATPTNTTYSNVSSASAGLAPKGAAVSSQSQSTKFLREDGSWAKPSYTTNTNTTYTFANGTNGFTVTPSGGSAQTVTVTPSIANNVTGSGTSGYIAKFNGGNTITNGPAIGSDTTKYLRNDGTWVKPPNDNTWTAMVGATSAANGSVGYVNAVPPKDGYNTKYLRADGTWTVPPDNNTTYSNVSTSAAGLAPKVTSTSKFLKGDGTWATPTNTWTAMVGATSAANGSVGYVNAVPPKIGYNSKFLRADGTWQEPGTYQADNTTGLNDYDVLFSGRQTGSGNYYSSTNKSSNFKYNPSEGNLTVSKVNGVDVTNLDTNLISKTTISCGMSDFTKTINLSAYAGHMVLISFTSDTTAIELTAGCVIAVPQFGAKARIIASDTSESYLSLSISGQTLTVSSRSGFWYGVIAYLYIL